MKAKIKADGTVKITLQDQDDIDLMTSLVGGLSGALAAQFGVEMSHVMDTWDTLSDVASYTRTKLSITNMDME